MTIETKYIANDGTVFDTEHECEEYERVNTSYLYLGWNSKGERVTGKDLGDIDRLYYVGVPTPEAYEQFNELSEAEGYEKLPPYTNFYPTIYQYGDDVWEDFGAFCNDCMTRCVAMLQEMRV